MKITRLKPGERAPDTADRAHINRFRDGKNGWIGALGHGREGVYGIGKNDYRSIKEAEREAIEWARGNDVRELLIETDDG